MNALERGPVTLPWPPIFFAAAVAVAILLGYLLPLPWLSGPLAEFLVAVGALLAAGGVALALLAVRGLRRGGTTVHPTQPARQLITSGPFAISRNPIYLGLTLVMIGLAFATANPWFAICGVLAAFVTGWVVIAAEERHLELRFGRRYRDYAKRVRRWI